MPSLKLKIQYNKNEGLIISPTELTENYLFGIPLNSSDGRRISQSSIKTHILSSQTKLENLLSIKLTKQVIEESRDFNREEFNCWGYIKTMYPVDYISNLQGFINNVAQVNYPKEWLSIKKTQHVAIYRNVSLIPNTAGSSGATMTQNSFMYSGLSPILGFFGQKYIPNYWRLKYTTGWDNTPQDLFDFIAKWAAINVLHIIGDILYGVGITNIQVSLDGVSQNTPLSRSAQGGIFGGRIKQYLQEMKDSFPDLKNQYRGIVFDTL